MGGIFFDSSHFSKTVATAWHQEIIDQARSSDEQGESILDEIKGLRKDLHSIVKRISSGSLLLCPHIAYQETGRDPSLTRSLSSTSHDRPRDLPGDLSQKLIGKSPVRSTDLCEMQLMLRIATSTRCLKMEVISPSLDTSLTLKSSSALNW